MSRNMVITGGEGDLAQALAGEFREAGWLVEAPGRSLLDVTDSAAVRSYFSSRPVDLLVCAAGITRDVIFPKIAPEDWDQVVDVNLKGAIRCARAVTETMFRQGSGHIVFVSSYSALHPPAGQIAYATAKAGLIGLTQSLASELGSFGIRVNAILPGFMETRMTAGVSEERREKVRMEHALERWNTPRCVARFLLTLQQDLPHTSGQVFQLDSRVA